MGTLVAVKKIENIFEHRSLAKRTLRELKLLRLFKHENVHTMQPCNRLLSFVLTEAFIADYEPRARDASAFEDVQQCLSGFRASGNRSGVRYSVSSRAHR